MPRTWFAISLLLLSGCGPAEPPAPEIPKDLVRLTPGPADPDAPQEFTTTASGLKYRILRKSDGKKPTADNKVRMHYRARFRNADGTFENGKILDSTYGSTGQSNTLAMNGMIKGMAEGIQLIGEGGMIELEIPPDLAYGESNTPGMPPNQTLHFIVELLEVK